MQEFCSDYIRGGINLIFNQKCGRGKSSIDENRRQLLTEGAEISTSGFGTRFRPLSSSLSLSLSS